METPTSVFEGMVKKYAHVGNVLNSDDTRKLSRLCELIKQKLQDKARQFVKDSNGAPILCHYSSDGTPLSTKRFVAATLASSGRRVRRVGAETVEYLVQYAALRRVENDGSVQSTMVLRDPLPLTEGKTALALYSAGRSFIPSLRRMGHVGVAIQHYVFDRAGYSALARVFKQHHALEGKQIRSSEAGGAPVELLDALSWVVSSACASHDAHNALKWSLHSCFKEPNMLKDMYVGIASLRNSYGMLVQYMGEWLCDSLVFVNDDELPPERTLQVMWTALGVEYDIVEELVSLGLIFHNGKLQIKASSVDTVADVVGAVSGVLLALWRFKTFSTSRWMTLGTSCRTLVAGYLSGLEVYVSFIRAKPDTSDFHIHGFQPLHLAEMKSFAIKIALIAYISDSFLNDLFEDNRLAKNVDAYEQRMAEEMEWISELDIAVWRLFAKVCGEGYRSLRSDVLSGGARVIRLHMASGIVSG